MTADRLAQALERLLNGNEWRCLQGEWAWHSMTIPANDDLTFARETLADYRSQSPAEGDGEREQFMAWQTRKGFSSDWGWDAWQARAAISAAASEPVAWMYERDGMVHDADHPPICTTARWQRPVVEPWTETPLCVAGPARRRPAERRHSYGRCTITGPAEDVAFIFKHLPDVEEANVQPKGMAKPIGVEVVGVVRPGGEDGPNVEWLLEGGLHAVAEGGETYLLVSHAPITNDDGYGEVVRVNHED